MFWNQYPYINLNDLNLDFLLKAIGEMQNEVENFVTLNAVKYADPIQWDISRQYEKNTIVIDPLTGTAYISVQPVPSGVALNRTDYWTPVFDLSRFITQGNENLTEHVEGAGIIYSTFALNQGDWVIWNGILYKALVNMPLGTAYSVDGNIERVTVEEYIKDIFTAIANEVQNRIDADNTIIANVNNTIGNLNTLTTLDKSSIVNAINSINLNVKWVAPEAFGAVGDGITDDTAAFIDCFANSVGCGVILTRTYLISNRVDIPDGCYILGVNGATIIDAWRKTTADDDDDKYHGILNIDSKNNITIDNVIFKGNSLGAAQSSTFYWGCDIAAWDSDNITIKNCTFDVCDLFTQIGLVNCTNITVINNQFNWYRYQGVALLHCKYCHINNNTFVDCGFNYVNTYAIGITYHDTPSNYSQYVECYNNLITYPNNTANWESIDAHGGRDLKICNNTIINCHTGIALFSEKTRNFLLVRAEILNNTIYKSTNCGIIAGGYDVKINGNSLMECNSSGVGAAIKLIAIIDTIDVSNNKITIPYGCFIIIAADTSWSVPKITRLNINGNTIENISQVNGKAYLLYFDSSSTQRIGVMSYFTNNVVMSNVISSYDLKLPDTLISPTQFLEFKGNCYNVDLNFDYFASVAPDVIKKANIPNVANIGGKGHEIAISDFTSGTGNVYKLVFNGSAYSQLVF